MISFLCIFQILLGVPYGVKAAHKGAYAIL